MASSSIIRQLVGASAARRLCNIAALAIGLLACLLLGEVLSRLYFAVTSGTGSKNLVFEGTITEHDPVLGFRLLPNARAELRSPEFSTVIETNERGLRESEDFPYERPTGRRRILLCGDSFTFGHGVNEADRYGERLATLLGDVEVINQGVFGTGTDQQLLLYREEGVKYGPDLVILAYFVENILRNAITMRFTVNGKAVYKPKFILENGQLVLSNVPVPDPGTALDEERIAREWWDRVGHQRSMGLPIPFKNQLRKHSAFYKLVHASTPRLRRMMLRASSNRYSEYEEGREEWAVTRAILRAFATEVRTHGSEFLLVLVPEKEFVYEDRFNDRPFEVISEFGENEGIPVLDLRLAFEEAARGGRHNLYYKIDSHWTASGHALAAEQIAAYLSREGWE